MLQDGARLLANPHDTHMHSQVHTLHMVKMVPAPQDMLYLVDVVVVPHNMDPVVHILTCFSFFLPVSLSWEVNIVGNLQCFSNS